MNKVLAVIIGLGVAFGISCGMAWLLQVLYKVIASGLFQAAIDAGTIPEKLNFWLAFAILFALSWIGKLLFGQRDKD